MISKQEYVHEILVSIWNPSLDLLTWRFQIERDDEAHYSQEGQVHDAGHPEEEARQAVQHAGGVTTDPLVAPGGSHGKRVHGDGRPQVGHRQVDAEQLGRLHLRRLPHCHNDDQQVPDDRENGCRGKREDGEEECEH